MISDAGDMMTLLGPAHLAIIATVVVLAMVLAGIARRRPARARLLRLLVGHGLAVNELIWYVFRYSTEGFRFPEGLPLQLCDITLWMTVAACLTLSRAATELTYFAGLAGAAMAIITPDLWAPLLSYPTMYFFLAHGGVVAGALLLVAGRLVALRPGSVWRAFALVNLYAAVIGIFNALFGTNYLYLCRKPEGASLLDFFGPWPVYILGGEVLALALFAILWIPLRSAAPQARAVTSAPV
ncbi:MAG TPA: TIGR02206 family membrane protein [Bryobacteraceae bacterium]|nr:TIGR02206 family membrane protein [Bryobacteraceae bacterium]